MIALGTLLLVLAAVCFMLAAVGVTTANTRVSINLTALGLFFWVLSLLLR